MCDAIFQMYTQCKFYNSRKLHWLDWLLLLYKLENKNFNFYVMEILSFIQLCYSSTLSQTSPCFYMSAVQSFETTCNEQFVLFPQLFSTLSAIFIKYNNVVCKCSTLEECKFFHLGKGYYCSTDLLLRTLSSLIPSCHRLLLKALLCGQSCLSQYFNSCPLPLIRIRLF